MPDYTARSLRSASLQGAPQGLNLHKHQRVVDQSMQCMTFLVPSTVWHRCRWDSTRVRAFTGLAPPMDPFAQNAGFGLRRPSTAVVGGPSGAPHAFSKRSRVDREHPRGREKHSPWRLRGLRALDRSPTKGLCILDVIVRCIMRACTFIDLRQLQPGLDR